MLGSTSSILKSTYDMSIFAIKRFPLFQKAQNNYTIMRDKSIREIFALKLYMSIFLLGYIVLYGFEGINWTDVESYCINNYTSHLASIHSVSDNDSLVNLRHNNGLSDIGWIGLSDQVNESVCNGQTAQILIGKIWIFLTSQIAAQQKIVWMCRQAVRDIGMIFRVIGHCIYSGATLIIVQPFQQPYQAYIQV